MGIKVTESRLYILMLEHLAEQADFGHVEDYIHNFITHAMWSHPAWRWCNNDGCGEYLYPRLECVPVADGSWKDYRVRVHPLEVCPACGGPTEYEKPLKGKKKVSDRAKAFAEGRSEPGNRVDVRPRQFDGHIPAYAIPPGE